MKVHGDCDPSEIAFHFSDPRATLLSLVDHPLVAGMSDLSVSLSEDQQFITLPIAVFCPIFGCACAHEHAAPPMDFQFNIQS